MGTCDLLCINFIRNVDFSIKKTKQIVLIFCHIEQCDAAAAAVEQCSNSRLCVAACVFCKTVGGVALVTATRQLRTTLTPC